jgi:hypothetical protein
MDDLSFEDSSIIDLEKASDKSEYKNSMFPTIQRATIDEIRFTWVLGHISGAGISKRGNVYPKVAAHILKVDVTTEEFSPNRFHVPFGINADGRLIALQNNNEVKEFYNKVPSAYKHIQALGIVSPAKKPKAVQALKEVGVSIGKGNMTPNSLLKHILSMDHEWVMGFTTKDSLSSAEAFKSLIIFADLGKEIQKVVNSFEHAVENEIATISISVKKRVELYIENEPLDGWGDYRHVNDITRFYSLDKMSLSEHNAIKKGEKNVKVGELFDFRVAKLEPKLKAEIEYRNKARIEAAHKRELEDATKTNIADPDLGVDDGFLDEQLAASTETKETPKPKKPKTVDLSMDEDLPF